MTNPRAYEVAWTPTAMRALERLPEKIATAVVEFAYGALADNPQRAGRRLRFEFEGKFSAHRGDYRVVYEVDESARVVTILAVDHRGKIYRAR